MDFCSVSSKNVFKNPNDSTFSIFDDPSTKDKKQKAIQKNIFGPETKTSPKSLFLDASEFADYFHPMMSVFGHHTTGGR